MFFIKFLEYRGAKLLGFGALKEARRLTGILEQCRSRRASKTQAVAFNAIKEYTLTICKLKREQTFSAYIFQQRWLRKRGVSLLRFNMLDARQAQV